jgi:glutamate-1-semialdehyde 2,1-aminomutase
MKADMTTPDRLPPRSTSQDDLVDRLRAVIPGGTMNSAVQPRGLEFIAERAKGAEIFDADGRRFLDFVMGGGPVILGHAHPRMIAALTRAAEFGTQHYVPHRRAIELAERIVRLVPCAEMVRYTASGTEATFHALRLARAVTGRSGIVKFDGAYHGHHDLAVWSFEHSPSDYPRPTSESAGTQSGVADDIRVLPFNDPDALGRLFAEEPDRFAAVICEPFQRALAPDPDFLRALRRECDSAGVVLVFDEVVTGFRFAPGGIQQKYGVVPDLATFGKALAGGLPMGALVGRRALMEHLAPGSPRETYSFHCGTFNGYLLGVEAAHTSLDMLVNEGGIERLQELTAALSERLEPVLADAGVATQLSAEGGVFQIYFTDRPVRTAADVRATDQRMAAAFHLHLQEAGIYKLPPKGYLSLAHTLDDFDEFAAASAWAIRASLDRPA